MVHVQAVAPKLGTVHFQRIDNVPLVAKLQQSEPAALVLGVAGVLNFTGRLEVFHQLLQPPIRANVQHQNGAARFLDLFGVKVYRQRRIFG